MEISNTPIEAIEAYAAEILDRYRDLTPHDWELPDKITFTVKPTEDLSYQITFNVPEYFYYAEHGRSPGRMPPVAAIEKWMLVKSIVPQLESTAPSLKQAAYCIARHIGEAGIKPTNYFQSAVNQVSTKDVAQSIAFEILNRLKNPTE